MINPRRITSLFLLTALCGCAQTEENLPPAPQVSMPESAGPPTLPPYRVQVGDLLDVKMFLNPELNEEVVVRPDGLISTAVAEDIAAYGHTPAEISAVLRDRYHSVLNSPQLTVVVHSFAPNRVYVAGEVNNPGEFITVGPNLTLSQAIARAGGVKTSAARGRVFVVRRTEGDKAVSLQLDYLDVISGAHPEADIRLAQYDVVYVPRTGIAEAAIFWNQWVQQFVPYNWGFSYNVNPFVTSGK
jgi:polysaccharide export outer membrane protein